MRFLPSALCLVCWGLWSFFPKIANRHLGHAVSAAVYEKAATVAFFAAVVVAGLVARQLAPSLALPETTLVWRPIGVAFAALTGVVGAMGAIFYYVAASRSDISVVAAVTATYPVVAVLLGWLVLGERLDARQWAGVALAITGVALVAPRG